jgi:hypothetical protein
MENRFGIASCFAESKKLAPTSAQELRNAVYAGPWTGDAKRYFSKTGCAAYGLAGDYLRGSAIRQEYLETAIAWHAVGGTIEDYMSKHQHDENAGASYGITSKGSSRG